eukprot:364992-Chlamydomonas_euryale.AAC.3
MPCFALLRQDQSPPAGRGPSACVGARPLPAVPRAVQRAHGCPTATQTRRGAAGCIRRRLTRCGARQRGASVGPQRRTTGAQRRTTGARRTCVTHASSMRNLQMWKLCCCWRGQVSWLFPAASAVEELSDTRAVGAIRVQLERPRCGGATWGDPGGVGAIRVQLERPRCGGPAWGDPGGVGATRVQLKRPRCNGPTWGDPGGVRWGDLGRPGWGGSNTCAVETTQVRWGDLGRPGWGGSNTCAVGATQVRWGDLGRPGRGGSEAHVSLAGTKLHTERHNKSGKDHQEQSQRRSARPPNERTEGALTCTHGWGIEWTHRRGIDLNAQKGN